MNLREPSRLPLTCENWYCLRSQPKHEHIAAANLRGMIHEIDVFCPRLKIKRKCRRGAVWFVEALFPGYLFAKFNPDIFMQTIKSVPGVKTVLSFGQTTAILRSEIIADLRVDFDENELHEVPDLLSPGEEVIIAAGPFRGIRASILRILPSSNRIQVLLDLLGRTTPVNVEIKDIITEKSTADRMIKIRV